MTRVWLVVAVIAFQALCAFFFIFNILSSVFGVPFFLMNWQIIELIEIGAALGLLLGLGLGTWILTRLLRRNARVERQLKVASGAFAELIEERFEEWGLTPAEKDVALFAIKGLSLAEIAAIRSTSEGTVKAQSTAIYRKAGVNSRPQLLSLFIDDLMGDGLVPPSRESGAGVIAPVSAPARHRA